MLVLALGKANQFPRVSAVNISHQQIYSETFSNMTPESSQAISVSNIFTGLEL